MVGNIQPPLPTCLNRRARSHTLAPLHSLTVLAYAAILIAPYSIPMSASSQSLGLAESQDTGGPGVSNQPEYELEDPAESWIALVDACRHLNIRARRSAVNTLLLKAKNSHWTPKLWTEIQEGYDSPTMAGDAEDGGDYAEQQHAPGYYEDQ